MKICFTYKWLLYFYFAFVILSLPSMLIANNKGEHEEGKQKGISVSKPLTIELLERSQYFEQKKIKEREASKEPEEGKKPEKGQETGQGPDYEPIKREIIKEQEGRYAPLPESAEGPPTFRYNLSDIDENDTYAFAIRDNNDNVKYHNIDDLAELFSRRQKVDPSDTEGHKWLNPYTKEPLKDHEKRRVLIYYFSRKLPKPSYEKLERVFANFLTGKMKLPASYPDDFNMEILPFTEDYTEDALLLERYANIDFLNDFFAGTAQDFRANLNQYRIIASKLLQNNKPKTWQVRPSSLPTHKSQKIAFRALSFIGDDMKEHNLRMGFIFGFGFCDVPEERLKADGLLDDAGVPLPYEEKKLKYQELNCEASAPKFLLLVAKNYDISLDKFYRAKKTDYPALTESDKIGLRDGDYQVIYYDIQDLFLRLSENNWTNPSTGTPLLPFEKRRVLIHYYSKDLPEPSFSQLESLFESFLSKKIELPDDYPDNLDVKVAEDRYKNQLLLERYLTFPFIDKFFAGEEFKGVVDLKEYHRIAQKLLESGPNDKWLIRSSSLEPANKEELQIRTLSIKKPDRVTHYRIGHIKEYAYFDLNESKLIKKNEPYAKDQLTLKDGRRVSISNIEFLTASIPQILILYKVELSQGRRATRSDYERTPPPKK